MGLAHEVTKSTKTHEGIEEWGAGTISVPAPAASAPAPGGAGPRAAPAGAPVPRRPPAGARRGASGRRAPPAAGLGRRWGDPIVAVARRRDAAGPTGGRQPAGVSDPDRRGPGGRR